MGISKMEPLLNRINEIFEKLAMLALVGMTIILCLQIFTRNLFDTGLVWADELTTYLNFWLTFLGAAVVFKDNGHIRLDYFVDRMNVKVRRVIDLFNILIIFFFMGFFLYSALMITNRLSNVSTQSMGLPYAYYFLAPILSTVFILIIAIHQLLSYFTKEAGRKQP